MVDQNTADIQQPLSLGTTANYLTWSEDFLPFYSDAMYPRCTDWRQAMPNQFSVAKDANLTGPSGLPGVNLITHNPTSRSHGYIEKNLHPVAHLAMRWGVHQNFSGYFAKHNSDLFAIEFLVKGRQSGDGTVTVFNKAYRAVFQFGGPGVPPTPRILTNLKTEHIEITPAGDLWRIALRGPGDADMLGADYVVRIYPTWGAAADYAQGKGTYITGLQLTKTRGPQPYKAVKHWGLWTPLV